MSTSPRSPSANAVCVLLLCRDTTSRAELSSLLNTLGYRYLAPALLDELQLLADEPVAVALIEGDATESSKALFGRTQALWPDMAAVMIEASRQVEPTGQGAHDTADVLGRPFGVEELRLALEKAMVIADVRVEPSEVGRLLGDSTQMREVQQRLLKVASSTATVLLRGESGTGKELAARALHNLSSRREAAFVKVQCAALPDALLESELFGYERGAFTGASARKLGRVDLAQGGTLFLDEIGDITLAMQVKLLRLLQDREYERLGGTSSLRADVRFVAATHRDLVTLVKEGQFREDLYYRLGVVTVWLPPLRARRDDIVPLVQHFCDYHCRANARTSLVFTAAALEKLRRERWPGNVRQLSNVIERLVLLSEGPEITSEDIAKELQSDVQDFVTQEAGTGKQVGTERPFERSPSTPGVQPLSEAVRAAESAALTRALRQARGNRTLAARLLGVSRATLYKKLEEHGVTERAALESGLAQNS